jgi:hypothetical protein
MRIAKAPLTMSQRARRRCLAPLGVLVSIAGMLAGCDSVGGGGVSLFPADIREQVIVFIQDFARQVLAAWLF